MNSGDDLSLPRDLVRHFRVPVLGLLHHLSGQVKTGMRLEEAMFLPLLHFPLRKTLMVGRLQKDIHKQN